MKNNLYSYRFELIFLSILLIGILFRYLNNFDQMFWNDENYTLFITDPSIKFEEFVKRHKAIDENPILYFYILRIFNGISYTAENLRLSSIIFSTLSIVASYKLFRIFYDKNTSLFCLAIISLNIFLIWQAKEARIASSVVFFGIINIILFHKFLISDKLKYGLSLFLINLFSLSYYPFLLMIIISQFFYVIFNNKTKIKSYLIISLLTLVFYIFLNIDYIFLKAGKPYHHFHLDMTFFINYFFRSFFGSIIFGGLSLLIFSVSFLKLILKKRNDFIIFNVYLIIVTYMFAISYSILKEGGVIAPRYYIFLIPSIIIIIVEFFHNKKFQNFKYIYLVLTLINSILLFDDWKIQKPRASFLLKNINTEISNNYFTDEGGINGYEQVFDYYFQNSSILKKKINYVSKNSIQKYDMINYICFNHAEMHVGLNKNIQNPLKCNKSLKNFSIFSEKEIKDFKIILYKKDIN